MSDALAGPTPGEIAQRWGGTITDADLPAFLAAAESAAKLDAHAADAVVYGPGRPDPVVREQVDRVDFMYEVGRPASGAELRGLPLRGCDACARMGGAPCDDHVRKAGEPIVRPPRSTWPSQQPGFVPGTVLVARPGAKYDVTKSVR